MTKLLRRSSHRFAFLSGPNLAVLGGIWTICRALAPSGDRAIGSARVYNVEDEFEDDDTVKGGGLFELNLSSWTTGVRLLVAIDPSGEESEGSKTGYSTG